MTSSDADNNHYLVDAASHRKLAAIARERGQTLPQLALAWVLRRPELTSALVGIRTVAQLQDNLGSRSNLDFAAEELAAIDAATWADTGPVALVVVGSSR